MLTLILGIFRDGHINPLTTQSVTQAADLAQRSSQEPQENILEARSELSQLSKTLSVMDRQRSDEVKAPLLGGFTDLYSHVPKEYTKKELQQTLNALKQAHAHMSEADSRIEHIRLMSQNRIEQVEVKKKIKAARWRSVKNLLRLPKKSPASSTPH